jgi:hypothetical protein
MRKILFTILVLGIILGMSDCANDKEEPVEKPKIYKVIYNVDYTKVDGEPTGYVPTDDNLYAEGDTFRPLNMNGIGYIPALFGGYRGPQGWLIMGAAAVRLDNPHYSVYEDEASWEGLFGENGKYYTGERCTITFGSNDITITAVWKITDVFPLINNN